MEVLGVVVLVVIGIIVLMILWYLFRSAIPTLLAFLLPIIVIIFGAITSLSSGLKMQGNIIVAVGLILATIYYKNECQVRLSHLINDYHLWKALTNKKKSIAIILFIIYLMLFVYNISLF